MYKLEINIPIDEYDQVSYDKVQRSSSWWKEKGAVYDSKANDWIIINEFDNTFRIVELMLLSFAEELPGAIYDYKRRKKSKGK